MEQQQFKVSFSLGTKLLLSIVTLLTVIITFLTISTILILTEDKRAYVYESQAHESVLAGREFLNTVRHSIDTLRLSLAGSNEITAIQSLLDNQEDLLTTSVFLLNPETQQITPRVLVFKPESLKLNQLTPADLEITPPLLQDVLAELKAHSFAFLNMTKSGGVPLIGVFFADFKTKVGAGYPIAFGAIPLKDFAGSLKGSRLAITTAQGRLLFHSDLATLYARKDFAKDPLLIESSGTAVEQGAKEFDESGEHFLGTYYHPGYNLLVLNKTEWKKAIRSAYTLSEKFVALGLAAIGAAVIFAIFFSRTLTSPINALYEATRDVASGKFDLQLKPSGRDEIGALTSSFKVMSQKIGDLIHESIERVRLENELAIASTVQQTLIPPPHFETDKILIESVYESASECGGDWWGFFGVGKKICILIGDATGHGLPSALMTASARSCFSVMQKLAQENPDFSFSPAGMLGYANRVVFDASLSKIMMTFFACVIDFETGKLTYASAGHNPPWLFKKDGSSFQLKSLIATGQRLGEKRDCEDFEEKEISIAKGDLLFLYTDGLMEGSNLAGEMFGKQKVRRAVEAQVASGPRAVVDGLMKEFHAYNTGKPLDDDVTIAVAKLI